MEKLLNIIYCVFYKYKMKRKGCKFSRRCKILREIIIFLDGLNIAGLAEELTLWMVAGFKVV